METAKQSYEIASEEIARIVAEAGITNKCALIGGRVRDNEWPCIEYRLEYERGRAKFSTPYSLGIGHVDYKRGWKNSEAFLFSAPLRLSSDENAALNTMYSKPHAILKDKALAASLAGKAAPNAAEALATCCRDAIKATESTFEEWAGNLGYGTDSRRAEKIYNTLRDTFAPLLALCGRETMAQLSALSCEL